ncbi:WxcM-like domain-containing protein [Dysgonomonas sp. 520]|uniref:WxcM-like domain-containing protein n=1 Tax=Dysgonomonas sp. 520 TaxID=2302931 RepID=UPI0013D05B96|nr:WxcM-like domain-containing protein [Dysgonomonas sp. 520]NDW08951.1 hypothetical protein [Dysgonomonas sp. 520]
MEPKIIEGGVFSDNRGTLSFVNDFKFDNINRFYIIENSTEDDTRAWHGHRKDVKNFYCIQGSFLVSYVKVDDWDNPSPDAKPERTMLSAEKSQVLVIPAGYANSVKALEKGSKLISFSTLPIEEAEGDSVRYDKSLWPTE